MTDDGTRHEIARRGVVARAYAGAGDLRKMQSAVAAGVASTIFRVGDLAWLLRHQTHRQLSLAIRLWEDADGRVVGWTFLNANGAFLVFVAPGRGDPEFIDELLDGVERAARSLLASGDVLTRLDTYGIVPTRSEEDRALAGGLERRGFTVEPFMGGLLLRALDDLPPPMVGEGFRLAPLETPAQVIGRVDAHRAAFAPSELTRQRYDRVRRTWPYRPALDRIAMTDSDEVVAFCTAWIDEENGTGLLEPVGVRPDHQRRGLGRAVCLDALHALRDAGARSAEVGFTTDAAFALYRSIGFSPNLVDMVYRKEIDLTS